MVLEKVQSFQSPGSDEVAEGISLCVAGAWQPGKIIKGKANCRTMENADLPEQLKVV